MTSVPAGILSATRPGGLELPGSIGPASNELHLVATKTFSLLVASVNEDAGTKLYGWKTMDGGWEPRFDIASEITAGLTAAAANDGDALVVWWTPTGIRGLQYPSAGPPIAIPTTGAITSLSAGGIDGGFLVSWVEGGTTAKAMRLTANSVPPLAFITGTTVTGATALTHPDHELLMSHTSVINLHRFMGTSWGTTAVGTPSSAPSFATSTAATALLVYPSAGSWVATAASVTNFAERTPGPSAVTNGGSSVKALAGRRDSDRALLVSEDTARSLQLHELAIARASGFLSSVSSAPPVKPLQAPAAQRSPSVVWYDPKQQFLLAWEEDSTDGGMAVNLSLLTPGQPAGPSQVLLINGASTQPQLLRAPRGARHAIALTESLTRAVHVIQPSTGQIVRGPALTLARSNLPFSVLGDQVAMHWGTLGGLTASANLEPGYRLVTAEPTPRCVATLNDKLWFFGHAFTYRVDDAPAASASMQMPVTWVGGPLSAPCAQGTPPTITIVGSDGGLVEFANFSPASSTVERIGTLGRFTDELTAQPVVASMDGGALVACAWASPVFGTRVAWVAPGVLTLGPSLGGDEVSSVSIASNPAGQAVVAWDTFDRVLGVRRVQFRYLLPPSPDGGIVVQDSGVIDQDSGVIDQDSGVIAQDSGVIAQDSGVIDQDSGVVAQDSGVMEQDSGVVAQDAGVVADSGVDQDAGVARDAGMEPDGGIDPPGFVAVCGCSQADSSALPFLLLAVLMLAVRRRSHV